RLRRRGERLRARQDRVLQLLDRRLRRHRARPHQRFRAVRRSDDAAGAGAGDLRRLDERAQSAVRDRRRRAGTFGIVCRLQRKVRRHHRHRYCRSRQACRVRAGGNRVPQQSPGDALGRGRAWALARKHSAAAYSPPNTLPALTLQVTPPVVTDLISVRVPGLIRLFEVIVAAPSSLPRITSAEQDVKSGVNVTRTRRAPPVAPVWIATIVLPAKLNLRFGVSPTRSFEPASRLLCMLRRWNTRPAVLT